MSSIIVIFPFFIVSPLPFRIAKPYNELIISEFSTPNEETIEYDAKKLYPKVYDLYFEFLISLQNNQIYYQNKNM